MAGAETGRFAPSPSGRMHLGNLFSSLLAWLSAKAAGGRVVLRIEDLDTRRCTRAYADQLEADYRALGLVWDEGGSSGGSHGPYYQSRRGKLYAAALESLRRKGLVYPCFCTRAQLHAASAPHREDGRTVYSGACRTLTSAQAEERARIRPPAFRLRVPDREIGFQDGHLGRYAENLERDCGDFLLRRSDGLWAYQLAVVVDDAAMEITQVVRGSDLLSSTPRQLYLYDLLELTPPEFYHVPLLLSPAGRRLSKRDGDLSLEVLLARSTPADIIGKLAYLAGLNPTAEPRTPESLLPDFSWDKISKGDIFLPEELFS
ncbi:glutamyl-tRNA synthetase [Oscillibacter valericigenes Sjm18-20]|nr:glutamyl-tRNA synthetase [Oscillibacter valericigenes Sjm18-20]